MTIRRRRRPITLLIANNFISTPAHLSLLIAPPPPPPSVRVLRVRILCKNNNQCVNTKALTARSVAAFNDTFGGFAFSAKTHRRRRKSRVSNTAKRWWRAICDRNIRYKVVIRSLSQLVHFMSPPRWMGRRGRSKRRIQNFQLQNDLHLLISLCRVGRSFSLSL